ncbi:hypothetical protein AK830_g6677 [Neonectria ditissima]|uniref:Homeobox domain-containing protein n=1 Tax=Neonectria ditissima TaxID=78410 RepID=A0A0P7AQ38_9HYPO|nr:hypothetical protein AK830_g6677 [Neonectria ditissima]
MDFSLDDLLFSGDDSAVAVPFDEVEPPIDWQANFDDAAAAHDVDFSFLQEPNPLTTIDEFFIKNGAHRPSEPCTHCRRRRLQCLILQTTAVNPNPTKSCSSCVALFRECSHSGREKRDHSNFETSMPVIGRLHGVSEGALDLSSKRTNTRSVRKTRVLRNWFATHLDHPYPSEEDKADLVQQSGLSKSQVINWFANSRRRHRLSAHAQSNQGNRVFRQGSPMPYQMGMSPMERWRSSPPEEEASASALESASTRSSSRSECYDLDPASDSYGYDASSNSASSCSQFRSRSSSTAFQAFQCTFCRQSYKKKYDWVRHERSIHLPGLDSWICSTPVPVPHRVWCVNESNPQCVFCGQVSPTDDHIQSHEFDACAERPVSERKFTRKDHLWQHLHKFHRCRKWDGFQPDLSLLQHRQDVVRSRCGFCQATTESWDERMDHIALHFRSGMTMDSWTGGCGILDMIGTT